MDPLVEFAKSSVEFPENEQNLKQIRPQAVEQFASIRRDDAKKGWWIQDANGNWSKK